MREYYIRKNGQPFIDNQMRVRFTVEVYPGGALSICEINIYNLSRDSEFKHGDTIELIAGYKNKAGALFSGVVINVFRERDRADIFHRVIARTGTVAGRGSTASTYGEGATIVDVLQDVADAWPLRLQIEEEQFEDTPPFTSGMSLDGNLVSILNQLAREYDFKWVEHIGRLIIVKEGEVREDASTIKISQMEGMEGIPEVNKGPHGLGVTVMKRLEPFVYPNSMIEVETGFSSFNTGNVYFGEIPEDVTANGIYNVISLVHRGDTHGDEWTTEIHGLRKGEEVTSYQSDLSGAEGYTDSGDGSLVWGKRVSQGFRAKVREIAGKLRTNPDYLMAVMAFETGETFDPTIRNAAGSGATGLIQFMPKTAQGLGTSTAKLARMTAEQQLDYVYLHYKPFTGRLNTLSDAYMAVLFPVAVGKSGSYVLFEKPSIAYNQNAGLDGNRDGKITKDEATARVAMKLEKGMKFKG